MYPVSRIETILKKLQSRLPALSEAERCMQRELREMEDKVRQYKGSIGQVGYRAAGGGGDCTMEPFLKTPPEIGPPQNYYTVVPMI